MKNRTLILTLFSLLFAVIGCTKFGKNITVEGRVLNPITNEPIKGITVFLHKSNYKTIQKTITEEDGKFRLSAGRLGPIWAGTDYYYKDYYDLGWDYDGKYYSELKVDKGEVMHVDYHLVPYGNLKLSINNINCIDSNDSIKVYRELLDVSNYETWSATHPYVQVGCQQTTSSDFFKVLMGKYHLWWTVHKGGAVTSYNDTIFINKNEQKIYTINY
ncbi:MAG: carboxypeptidase-like regulatory domain-containing protein [Brumimicrobium sp.]